MRELKNDEWDFRIREDYLVGGVALVGIRESANGKMEILTFNIQVIETEKFEAYPLIPAIISHRDEARTRMLHNLASELVASGYATAPIEEISGQLRATTAHLQDMRKIVFKQVGIDLGEGL